jgi:hypothetical protein
MVYFINKETLNITYNFIYFNKMNDQTKFKKSYNLKNGRRTVLTLQRASGTGADQDIHVRLMST